MKKKKKVTQKRQKNFFLPFRGCRSHDQFVKSKKGPLLTELTPDTDQISDGSEEEGYGGYSPSVEHYFGGAFQSSNYSL